MNFKRNILVIGASGYLGRTIASRLHHRHCVVETHYEHPRSRRSVRYAFPDDQLLELVATNNIDTIIFSAEIEKNQQHNSPLEDAEVLADVFRATLSPVSHLRVVYISSDGIFSGATGMYDECEIPEPQTTYGHNLMVCENVVRDTCQNWCIVRPSYLFGFSCGKLDGRLSGTSELCKSGETPSFFVDMFKSPIHVSDAAESIIRLALGDHVGIVHVGGKRMSVANFHREGMRALEVAGHIDAVAMPHDKGLLRDTSLETSLCTRLTNVKPGSVVDSFYRYKDVAELVDEVFTLKKSTLFDDTPTSMFTLDNGTKLFCAVKESKRRDATPSEYPGRFPRCSCSWHDESFEVTVGSSLRIFQADGKAIQFRRTCGPEPDRSHIVDLFQLAAQIQPGGLVVTNLPGSGASMPQHWHGQIHSIGETGVLGELIRNIRLAEESEVVHGTRITEIVSPVWGVLIEFDSSRAPKVVGETIYEAIHRGIRYESQMSISYNLYVVTGDIRRVFVVFRDSGSESPFTLKDVRVVMDAKVGNAEGGEVSSRHANWRWGAIEVLGGLLARHSCISSLDASVWNQVFELVQIDAEIRPKITTEIQEHLHRLLQ